MLCSVPSAPLRFSLNGVPAGHDLITVGETPFTHDASALAAYVLPQNKELNMVFSFELMDLDSPVESPLVKKAWRLAELKAVVGRDRKSTRLNSSHVD